MWGPVSFPHPTCGGTRWTTHQAPARRPVGGLRHDEPMDPRDVLTQRLATQRLSSAPLPRAADVVRLLGAVQCQERDHAFFSLGLRSRTSTYAAVAAELDAGRFLRTHVLRPTWHFVAPEDLRWMLSLTSGRVLSGMRARHHELGLDDAPRLDAGLRLLTGLLEGRSFLTRPEVGAAFTERRSPIRPGPQLGHLLLIAELRGLVCSGPMKGVHHSYALVDEVVDRARPLDRDEALVELVSRFFAGHGPASVRDFTRWSSLTGTDTRAALDALGDRLAEVDVEGVPHWYDPREVRRRSPAAPAAYLFPVYDEVVLTYPQAGFPLARDHPSVARPDPFWARVVHGGVDVGLWKRTLSPRDVQVRVRLAPSLPATARSEVRAAAQRLAAFVERDLTYLEEPARPR